MTALDPNDKVLYRSRGMYGQACYMGRRTAAHLDATREKLARLGRDVTVIQSAYNTTVAASAGTHDKDACLDVYIPGMDWWAQQKFLRENGWAAFYRYPPLFSSHIHMISLGYGSAPVGIYVPGQVSDYYNHRNGLAGHASDPSWHPDSIAATIYRYGKDDTMAIEPEDWNHIENLLDKQEKRILRGVSGARVAAEQRQQRMLKALADQWRDIDAAVEDATDEVKAKVDAARKTTVAAVQKAAREQDGDEDVEPARPAKP